MITAYSSNISNSKNNFEGAYIGGYIGGAWGNSKFNTNAGSLSSTSYFTSTPNIQSVNQNGSQNVQPNNVIGGVQASNNWVINNLIYGISLDFGSFNLQKAHYSSDIPYPTFRATYFMQTSVKTTWLFTARGRFGFIPYDSWPLIYATGGLALTDLKVSNSFYDNAPSQGYGKSNNTNTKAGWTLGGGLELPLTNHFSLNGEYLYTQFGSVSTYGKVVGIQGKTSQLNTSTNLSANLFRIGINYKI